jgi:2-octaprenyl-6-methoxyphenol hydroxylase
MTAAGGPHAEFDVVIAGGGMVGASLAVALATQPLRIAVIERAPFHGGVSASFDSRTIALSRNSRRILETLGLWSRLSDAAWPIRAIHVSQRGRFGSAVIDAAEQSVPALGHAIDGRALGTSVWGAVSGCDNVTVLAPAVAVSAVTATDSASVIVDTNGTKRSLSCRLLVVADGSHSPLRDSLGITADIRPYGQTAIIGHVGADPSRTTDVAFERFTANGPLAMLPAGPGRFSFVMTRTTPDAAAILAMPDSGFLALLQSEFGHRLGTLHRLGKRSAYELELVRSQRVTTERAALVGNAAHGLHPVAGQGFNLGLRDVAALAEVIADDRHDRSTLADPGTPAVLTRYRDWRRRDQRNVVAFTDGLIRLFDLPGEATGLARGAGLLAFDLLPGAKAALAREAMGIGGRMSRLARGLPL